MKYKLKTSTSNFNIITQTIRDSSLSVTGTFFGFMMMGVFMFAGDNVCAANYTYSIIYDDNVVSNMPTDVSSITVNDSVNISGNIPTRNGYTFTGWNTIADGAGMSYDAGGTLMIDGSTSNNYKLYAMWKEDKCKPNGVTIGTISCMQDISSNNKAAILSSMTTGTAYRLYDKRDDISYHVAKLADGNIWMLDNLALDPTTVTLDTLKSNTNASAQALTYLKNGGGSGRYPANGIINKTSGWDIASLSDTFVYPYVNASSKDVIPYGAMDGGKGDNRVGVYYNYCAASAGSYCYVGGGGTGDATEDLCPAGWRMPTGGYSGEYQTLYVAYASDINSFRTALSIPLSGYFDTDSAKVQGSRGIFWSSTRYHGNGMYDLSVSSDNVGFMDYNFRSVGLSVRCVAQ